MLLDSVNQPARAAEDLPSVSQVSDWAAGGERRKEQDRRQSERQGKYDRRKNRCQLCRFFQEASGNPEALGTCLFHRTPMAAQAFACPQFEPPGGESRKSP